MKKLIPILILLFVTSGFANEIEWSSGNFNMTAAQCSDSDCENDTLRLTDDVTGGGKALDIAVGCDGLTVVLTGYTIEHSGIGFSMHSDNVKIPTQLVRETGDSRWRT